MPPCPARGLPWIALTLALALPSPPHANADDADCRPLVAQASGLLRESQTLTSQGLAVKAQSVALRGLELMERALGVCPQDREVCGLGVFLCVFAGEAARAEQWLERYTSLTPYGDRDPQLHYLRATVQARLLERPDLAIRSLERMQALAPDLTPQQRDNLYYEALLGHSSLLAREQRWEEAIRLLNAASLVASRRGQVTKARRARGMVGFLHGRAMRHKEALDIFQQLRSEEPESPVWSYQVGLSLALLLRYEEASSAYRHSLAHQVGYRDDPRVLSDLLKARLRLGNCLRLMAGTASDPVRREKLLREAQAELESYVAAQPKDPAGPLWVGVLLFEERDDACAALPWFERAFNLDQECQGTLDFLLRSHQRCGAPPTPAGRSATPEELAAWEAKAEAWRADRDANEKRRADEMDKRERDSGDPFGGCL